MKSNILMYGIVALFLVMVPVSMILIVGSSSVSFTTLFLYLVPVAFCAVIVTSLLFHRKSQVRG